MMNDELKEVFGGEITGYAGICWNLWGWCASNTQNTHQIQKYTSNTQGVALCYWIRPFRAMWGGNGWPRFLFSHISHLLTLSPLTSHLLALSLSLTPLTLSHLSPLKK